MSDLQPFQQRVVEEQAALEAKLDALRAFWNTPAFDALDLAERQLLLKQGRSMMEYEDILLHRIRAFRAASSIRVQQDCKSGSVQGLSSSTLSCSNTFEEKTVAHNREPLAVQIAADEAFIAGFLCAGGELLEAQNQAAQFLACMRAGKKMPNVTVE